MTSPKVGDVWLAHVEFSDHPGVGKVRPVVVIDVREHNSTVIAAKVTSKDLRTRVHACVPIYNWERCGLRKPSSVRLDQKFELAVERLLRDAPVGVLPSPHVALIADALANLA